MRIVYSQHNCPACVKLKAEYDRDGVDYKEIIIGEDMSKEDFFKFYPNVRSVPFVIPADMARG